MIDAIVCLYFYSCSRNFLLIFFRMSSVMAKNEGWFSEHCMILGITSPENKKYYICAAFPTGSGKTNLATLVPTIPGAFKYENSRNFLIID